MTRTETTTRRVRELGLDPNDYLRALLLERAKAAGLTDSAIARAHNRAYSDSTLAASTVQRFREGTNATSPPASTLMQAAYAVALGTTVTALWRDAIRRWRSQRYSANRVFLRRTYVDGTVEEFDLELDGNRIVGNVPGPDTSACGPLCSDEYIIEWADPPDPSAQERAD